MASRKDGGGKPMSLGWSTGLAGGKGVREVVVMVKGVAE